MNTPRGIDERLSDLLLAWEESVAAGEPLSAAALCREAPELLLELEREIRRLQAIDHFMSGNKDHEPAQSSCTSGSDQAHGGFPTMPGYEVLEELGRGGMGVVYKARQHSLNRLVAVKTLVGGRWGQPGFVARLRQEALALSRINHRGVVQVIDVIETGHAVSIVLEYVEGGSLASRQRGAPLPPAEAARLTLTIARTLAAVHAQGILHRDIKPGNVLVGRTGEIKISDFGLAKEEGRSDGLTVPGELLGSPAYMAPEQAHGRIDEIGVRTDVYSIGATLYELLTGRPPFQAASHVDILRHVIDVDPVPPRMLNPGIPRDLDTLTMKCLEKEPPRRFSSADELADELERFLSGNPISSRPIGLFDRFWRWCRRRPAAAALVAVSVAASIVVVAGLSLHYRNLTKYTRDLAQLNAELTRATTTAQDLQRTAEEHERQAKEGLYASDMDRAASAWRDADTQGLTELLERHVPLSNESDRRGFEWWYLHRRATLARQVLLDVGSPVYLLRYSSDRGVLAAAGKDAIVRLFDPATGRILRELATGQLEVNGLAFSSDGTELGTAGDDGTVRIWNLETGAQRLSIDAHPDKAFVVLFTRDGRRIITCGNDPLIRVFDARSGGPSGTLEGHRDTVQNLILANDGKRFISGGNDAARIWDLETAREMSHIATTGAVRSLAADWDRNLLVTGTVDGYVQAWDIRDGRKLAEVTHLDAIESLALDPGGSLLAAGDRSGGIRVWQMNADGEIVPDSLRVWQAHQRITYSLVWSSDGSRLISSGHEGQIISWRVSGEARDAGPSRFSVGNANAFALVPGTDSLLTTAIDQRRLIRWNWRTGKQEELLPGDSYDDLRVSPDAKFVAARRHPPALHVFPLAGLSGERAPAAPLFEWNPGGTIRGMQFSPESRAIAVPFQKEGFGDSLDNQAVWLHGSPGFQHSERIPVAGAKTVAFAGDGRRLAVGKDTGLVLWDLAARRAVWERPQTDFSSIMFSPDGKLVVTGGVGRLVIVRDATDGRVRFRLASHRARIDAFAFSPDSRTLATASADGAIKLWHVPTGQELFELRGPGTPCNRLEFADDRNLLTLISVPGPDRNEMLVFQAGDE